MTIAGHSLGSALATLTALDLVTKVPGLDRITSLYTFGSPLVGDHRFAAYFDNRVQDTYRIWNPKDWIANLPFPPYEHVAGDGVRLDQTEDQANHLCPSLGCQHDLLTHLWLLNSPDNPFLAEFEAKCGCSGADQISALKMLQAMRQEHSASEAACLNATNPIL